jgi:hypothetical protein
MTIREITTDEELIRSGFEGSQYYEGKPLLLIPLIDDSLIQKDSKYSKFYATYYTLSNEAKDWFLQNSPTSYYTVRSGLTDSYGKKMMYGCFVFDDENEMLHFKMRWWPEGGI